MRICVTGAGGFIGYHLAEELKRRGHFVRGVDLKEPEFAPSTCDEFELLDLRDTPAARAAVRGMDWVFGLAANMGGMGHILSHHSEIVRDNLMININTLDASVMYGVSRYFFSSSVCVYPKERQMNIDLMEPMTEVDAIPADPMGAYGWEKLMFEQMLQHYRADYDIDVRIARFHNTYGPYGTWRGGREKAPAALCRKVATAKLISGGIPPRDIEVWGDGRQIRQYTYVGDVVDGVIKLMESDYHLPVNIGSESQISVEDMLFVIANIAGILVKPVYVPGPEGVRYRLFDNSLSREVLDGWKPKVGFRDGFRETYWWIENMVRCEWMNDRATSQLRDLDGGYYGG